MSLGDKTKLHQLHEQLRTLDEERKRIQLEIASEEKIARLKTTPTPEIVTQNLGEPTLSAPPATPDQKVSLFLSLFRCRQEIHPKRWENPGSNKQGYAPVCANEWIKPICKKPEIKCTACTYQKFLPLDESAIESHLRRLSTIGTYAIREDDTCTFLACDFDESSWMIDAFTYQKAALSLKIEVSIERSRSGNGAHAWIFFSEPIPARLARSLGTLIITKCSEINPRLSFESYDRFFPSQDYLPRGGFGNLIALPLQKHSRDKENSCFIDEMGTPIPDQWKFLSGIRRLGLSEVRTLLDHFLSKIKVINRDEQFDDHSWNVDQAIMEHSVKEKLEPSLLGVPIELSLGSMLHIPLDGLNGKIVARLKKTASFPNPEFYKRQRMRMQTYPEKRFIFSGQVRENELRLPRGTLDEAIRILSQAGASVVIRDERIAKRKIKTIFSGSLKPNQMSAIKELKKHDTGVLVAPPGAGKTVIGCALIAERNVTTLILVHRQNILDQWKKSIHEFLGIPLKEIGQLSGTKKKLSGKIDLCSILTLAKVEDYQEIALNYSQIIIDECHHLPAASFEAILKELPARYICGLTATPKRKDGLENILYQQCGPIRHEIKSIDGAALEKLVTIYETGFKTPEHVGKPPPYHLIIEHLTKDESRNQKITQLTMAALEQGRFPLLISDRKGHLEKLELFIQESSETIDALKSLKVFKLDSGVSSKRRKAVLDEIDECRLNKNPLIILSTASLIGEGFDLPALDTLILAMPLSFEGRMVQYAGRIHRLAEGKTDVQIIDFVDSFSAMLFKMYKNRIRAYQKMDYTIREPSGIFSGGRLLSASSNDELENSEFQFK